MNCTQMLILSSAADCNVISSTTNGSNSVTDISHRMLYHDKSTMTTEAPMIPSPLYMYEIHVFDVMGQMTTLIVYQLGRLTTTCQKGFRQNWSIRLNGNKNHQILIEIHGWVHQHEMRSKNILDKQCVARCLQTHATKGKTLWEFLCNVDVSASPEENVLCLPTKPSMAVMNQSYSHESMQLLELACFWSVLSSFDFGTPPFFARFSFWKKL